MSKYRLALDLQLFAEGDGVDSGVDVVPAAGGQTGDGSGAIADPGVEKAFASRLAAERSKIESEFAEKYKDYDTHKSISEFFQQYNEMDPMTLKERIEMERLQEQAADHKVPVEVMRRLQELEAKAARGEELEQKDKQTEWERTYNTALDAYTKDLDGVDSKAINQFLVENGMSVDPQNPNKAFDIAYKAVRHDLLEKKLQTAEKDGMKKLLGAKGSIPTVTNSTVQGQAASSSPKTFAEARARAYQRMNQTE